ncbi:MAG: flagellar hook-basal body complex protein [Deltaproteobacteria bacterium]|jgi:flagellar hook-basal body protein|nr:flagellar hook-basal body complex protein [Deltaproteobacteria bacterium]
MSISSAMYAAVTGLSALSTGMQVISNNIANVNTVGFKAARTNYEDLISQDYWSNGKIQQIGRGVKVSTIQQMFTQGAFINSAQDTDMAIAGEGFFQVRDRVTNELMYTRAGNFTFDKDGVLESPAGYVLQGWELSIPKPGEDPVRIGVPTDVKVVILNAPPVETGQIKVVCNLNADDKSAYIYNSAEYAVSYADMLARGPAESARIASAHEVYDFSSNGSAYLNSSEVFNQAYISWMSAHGYQPVTSGSSIIFIKEDEKNPNAAQIKAAVNSASAAGWKALGIKYGSASIWYPMSANGQADPFYNSAYSAYLVNLGYSHIPNSSVFYKTTSYAAIATDMAYADKSALSATHIGSYPSTSAAGNRAYESAYNDYMVNNLGYTAPVRIYTAAPDPAALDRASAYAGGVAGGDGYPYAATSAYSALLYEEAYVHYLVRSGYTVSLDYPMPPLPSFYGSASASVKHAAAADAAARVNTALSETVTSANFATTNSAEGKYLYVSEYLDYLSANGYDIAPYGAAAFSRPAFNEVVNPVSHNSASAYANAQTGHTWVGTAGTGSTIGDLEYLAYYTNYMVKTANPPYTVNAGGTTITNPAGFEYLTKSPVTLTNPDLGYAQSAGTLNARDIDNDFVKYGEPPDAVDNLLYVAMYTKKLVELGYTLAGSYVAPAKPAAAQINLASPAAVMSAANAAGISSAMSAGATSGYTYPAGTPEPFATWDAAYLSAYNAYMTTHGYPNSRLNLTGYVKIENKFPTPTEYDAARQAGLTAIRPYIDIEYPSEPPADPFAIAFNSAYVAYMSSLGFVKITPQPSEAPYFQSVMLTSATSAVLLDASRAARAAAEVAAKNAGQAAYNRVYKEEYDKALAYLYDDLKLPEWLMEGMGFAGAWDGTDLESPIDPENYTHANPWTIYDSLGTAHTLMVYYQPNPHMENVWDYIITCDPKEDARKDVNNNVVMNGSTFAGIIQKGKITFTADGPDRHGGLIKDIEAQNIDLAKTAIARLTSATTVVQSAATASSLNHATFGGYYTGKPAFSASTGSMASTDRTYTLTWVSNLGTVPNVSGFTWKDTDGNSGVIQIYDKNYAGPYVFGSGLTVNFSKGGTPMRFTSGDTLDVTAHSESIGWTNLTPNAEGYFDFDVAFVQSASMALHPPYPPGLPTIIQHISLDMGARFNPAMADADHDRWILDEQGTTQYASKSLNIFSSQDGYPPGSLQRVSIDKDGVLTGIYTNGRHQPLYQIGLARFLNPWGLAKLGDNVYMETRWSGTGTINPPGYGGTGTIRANFLEQSNTDLAEEIVNMIVTQRGFQANSKVVTTTDTMLAEVIEMKR